VPQRYPGPLEASLDRVDADVQTPRDVHLREPFDEGELRDGALLVGKLGDCLVDVACQAAADQVSKGTVGRTPLLGPEPLDVGGVESVNLARLGRGGSGRRTCSWRCASAMCQSASAPRSEAAPRARGRTSPARDPPRPWCCGSSAAHRRGSCARSAGAGSRRSPVRRRTPPVPRRWHAAARLVSGGRTSPTQRSSMARQAATCSAFSASSAAARSSMARIRSSASR
jgi:hypothetical protein